MNRIRIGAAMTAVFSLAASAMAQRPAILRGQVYVCDTGMPVAGAPVTVLNLDDGTHFDLRSDAHGRFVRVGLAPGRYRVGATIEHGTERRSAYREARLEADDLVDARIGVWDRLMTRHGCEPYLIPPAISTSDRYIIH